MAISNLTTGIRTGVCTSTTRPTAPYNGQVIYETDTKQTLVYNGSGWVMLTDANAPVGVQLVAKFTASGTSRSVDCDNVFSDSFLRYRVIGEMRSTINTNGFFFQLRNSAGTALNTNYYSTAYGQDYAGGGTGFSVLNATTVGYVGWIPNSSSSLCTFAFDIHNTRSATHCTSWQGLHQGISSGASYFGGSMIGTRTVAELNRGIVFDNGGAGNLTGSISIYGYRDSI